MLLAIPPPTHTHPTTPPPLKMDAGEMLITQGQPDACTVQRLGRAQPNLKAPGWICSAPRLFNYRRPKPQQRHPLYPFYYKRYTSPLQSVCLCVWGGLFVHMLLLSWVKWEALVLSVCVLEDTVVSMMLQIWKLHSSASYNISLSNHFLLDVCLFSDFL